MDSWFEYGRLAADSHLEVFYRDHRKTAPDFRTQMLELHVSYVPTPCSVAALLDVCCTAGRSRESRPLFRIPPIRVDILSEIPS